MAVILNMFRCDLIFKKMPKVKVNRSNGKSLKMASEVFEISLVHKIDKAENEKIEI